ncbi:MAG: hypothetical protein HND56_03320 [Pseudomonadota bacterium]|nr:hypothetical protein [Pseudomonadota bacterium]QKK04776.1 MAG: hypothetical protein HND56_03320 [Pseudomonadota bacterium]
MTEQQAPHPALGGIMTRIADWNEMMRYDGAALSHEQIRDLRNNFYKEMVMLHAEGGIAALPDFSDYSDFVCAFSATASKLRVHTEALVLGCLKAAEDDGLSLKAAEERMRRHTAYHERYYGNATHPAGEQSPAVMRHLVAIFEQNERPIKAANTGAVLNSPEVRRGLLNPKK